MLAVASMVTHAIIPQDKDNTMTNSPIQTGGVEKS